MSLETREWEGAEIKEGHRFSMLFDQNGGTTGIPALRCCAAAAVIILRGTREREKPFKTRSSSPGWAEAQFHPLNFSLAPSAGRADTRAGLNKSSAGVLGEELIHLPSAPGAERRCSVISLI